MKVLKYFLMVVLTVCLASCGGKNSSGSKESFDVTVDNTTIGGKLSKYFSLADKTYKYNKGIIDKVTVELTCIEPLPENLKAYIGVEVLDEDGNVGLCVITTPYSRSEGEKTIRKHRTSKCMYFRFPYNSDGDYISSLGPVQSVLL